MASGFDLHVAFEVGDDLMAAVFHLQFVGRLLLADFALQRLAVLDPQHGVSAAAAVGALVDGAIAVQQPDVVLALPPMVRMLGRNHDRFAGTIRRQFDLPAGQVGRRPAADRQRHAHAPASLRTNTRCAGQSKPAISR